MQQIDVAPTVALLLGLELGGAEGRPLIGILPSTLQRPAQRPASGAGAR